jgi:hypothetical protein
MHKRRAKVADKTARTRSDIVSAMSASRATPRRNTPYDPAGATHQRTLNMIGEWVAEIRDALIAVAGAIASKELKRPRRTKSRR